jgi:uncharacterized protein YjbI with pentapeptide repeats
MPFSFKSLFSGSRGSTLTLDVAPREDAPAPELTGAAGEPEATAASDVRDNVHPDGQPSDSATAPAANPNADPLQQALLREFLAQEFLVQQQQPAPADAVVSPALDEKLAEPHVPDAKSVGSQPPAASAPTPKLFDPVATSAHELVGTPTPKPKLAQPNFYASAFSKILGSPAPKPDAQPEREPAITTEPDLDSTPESKLESKPEANPAPKLDHKIAHEPKVELKPEQTLEQKPEPKSESKPEPQPEAKVEPSPSAQVEPAKSAPVATPVPAPTPVASQPATTLDADELNAIASLTEISATESATRETKRESAAEPAADLAPEPVLDPRAIATPTDIDEILATIGSVSAPQLNEPTGELFDAQAQTVPALADVAPDAYVLKPRVDPGEWALEETLAAHREWLDSHGAAGTRADLRKGSYESTELISVNLRYADLQDINLRAADLLLADLRDTCLVRSDFSEACLVGTNFEGANLEGAALENSMGLVARQIAGANVHEASLPAPVLEFRALIDFARSAKIAVRLFTTTIVLSVIALIMIFKTRDVQLLADSGILSFLPSRALASALPSDQLYLVAPIVLFVIYLWFLYNLQRVWDAVLELPAVFPDGRTLNTDGSRIISGLLRTHFHWMNAHAPSTRRIEKTISVALAYWTVPLVILCFWARYLTVQDIHGTLLHELLILLSTSVAFYCTTRTGRQSESWLSAPEDRHPILDKLKLIKPEHGLAALAAVLTFLSLGTIYGVPRDTERAPQYGAANIRRWAPTVLWAFGVDPYAELTEAGISRRPENFDGSEAALAGVSGAHLVGSNFRYAQLYGGFLANAHLFRSNFDGAFMSQADMRGADLSQSTLEDTNLDMARMSRVNLDRASLAGATLSRTDLRNANLSHATLTGATLIDARMDGASLYGAHLENASAIRANMNKADLRDSHLDNANLEHSDLREAYFWSAKLPGANLRNAQLATAIFIDADLSHADLSGAQFNGTVLNGANLHDAILDNADVRGALQLSAAQVCTTKSRNGAQFDDALAAQIDNLCGTGPHVAAPASTTAPATTTPATASPAAPASKSDAKPAQKSASH